MRIRLVEADKIEPKTAQSNTENPAQVTNADAQQQPTNATKTQSQNVQQGQLSWTNDLLKEAKLPDENQMRTYFADFVRGETFKAFAGTQGAQTGKNSNVRIAPHLLSQIKRFLDEDNLDRALEALSQIYDDISRNQTMTRSFIISFLAVTGTSKYTKYLIDCFYQSMTYGGFSYHNKGLAFLLGFNRNGKISKEHLENVTFVEKGYRDGNSQIPPYNWLFLDSLYNRDKEDFEYTLSTLATISSKNRFASYYIVSDDRDRIRLFNMMFLPNGTIKPAGRGGYKPSEDTIHNVIERFDQVHEVERVAKKSDKKKQTDGNASKKYALLMAYSKLYKVSKEALKKDDNFLKFVEDIKQKFLAVKDWISLQNENSLAKHIDYLISTASKSKQLIDIYSSYFANTAMTNVQPLTVPGSKITNEDAKLWNVFFDDLYQLLISVSKSIRGKSDNSSTSSDDDTPTSPAEFKPETPNKLTNDAQSKQYTPERVNRRENPRRVKFTAKSSRNNA